MAKCLGIFDSGLGGLTVLKEILKTSAADRIVYFGDTGRVPYGSRTKEIITEYSRQDVRFLLSKGADEIIVACGTASANALEQLQQEFTVPLAGVIDVSARAAMAATRSGRIGVIGTAATIRSQIYRQKIAQEYQLTAQACPLFVPLVEYGLANDALAGSIVADTVAYYLQPLKEQGVDTLILGCTHYPLLEKPIQDFMGPDVVLINSGIELARQYKPASQPPRVEFYVSDDAASFGRNGALFLQSVGCLTAQKIDIAKY